MSACAPTRHDRTPRRSRPRPRLGNEESSQPTAHRRRPPPANRGRGCVRLDHRLPHRRPHVARPRPRRGRPAGGRAGGSGHRRHRRRAARGHTAPGQRAFRRADRRHGRVDPGLRLAHDLRHHGRRRTAPDPPGHPESRAQRARRQPGDRARDAGRYRCGHRARPAAHHAGRVTPELRGGQRPGPAGAAGPDQSGGPPHRGAGHRRSAAVAPAAGTGRPDGTENPGRTRLGGDRDLGGGGGDARAPPGRPAFLAVARPAGAASGTRSRPGHRGVHRAAGGQSGITARRGGRGQTGRRPRGRAGTPDLPRSAPAVRPGP
ncbi:hypothetical protein SMICM304S_08545 [Streptomyces microflavus]